MAQSVYYRVKSPQGAWIQAVVDETSLPESITGLVAGETYEVDPGGGVLVDATPTAAGITGTSLGYSAAFDPNGSTTLNCSTLAENDVVYLTIPGRFGTKSQTINTLALEGASATRIGGTPSSLSRPFVEFWKVTINAAAAGNAAASLVGTASVAGGSCRVHMHKVVGTVGTETVVTSPDATYGSSTPRSINVASVASGFVMAGASVEDSGGTPTIAWTGATEIGTDQAIADSDVVSAAEVASPAAGTQNIDVAFTFNSETCAASLSLQP